MKLGSKKQLVWFGVMGLLLCATAYTILSQQSPRELAAAIARADALAGPSGDGPVHRL